jgi:hypothetical protein
MSQGVDLTTVDGPTVQEVDLPDETQDANIADVPDASTIDMAEDIATDTRSYEGLTVSITMPMTNTSFEDGMAALFSGLVEGVTNPDQNIQVRWTSDIDGVLQTGAPGFDGVTSYGSMALTPGFHIISLHATAPDGTEARDQISIGACGWEEIANFDNDLGGWTAFGDAVRDSRGFLELTGNLQARKGGLFDLTQRLDPGSTHLRFRISTGSCPDPGICPSAGGGADGFAMSIIDVSDPAEIGMIFGAAKSGGGLGYGVSGCYGPLTVRGFHVEFDTWYNQHNGNSEFHTDPHDGDHVEITLDGDPGGPDCSTTSTNLFAPIKLEDNFWHDIEVRIANQQVEVWMDNISIIQGTLPGLQFKGGYIGFTGTTGFYSNFHRFDDLGQQPLCRFQ